MKPYYEHAGITIYHGDCREVLPTLTEKVDLVLTDPPYGIGIVKNGTIGGNNRALAGNYVPIHGDDEPFDPSTLLTFPRVILFGANHYAGRLPCSPTWLVWDKKDGTSSDMVADCELAWSNIGGPARLYRHLWRGMIRASEWDIKRVHPTQKPVSLMLWCLKQANATGLVLDPYMGSGSVLVAAKQLGLPAIGIEIEERYCEIAAKRLAQEVLPL